MDTSTSINCDVQTLHEQDDLINDRSKEYEDQYAKQNKYKTALPQVIATGAQSLLLLALGMMVAMPTVVIAALHNAKSGLSITDTEASWFAGIIFACQPIGSILSGILSDKFGRKRCMLLVSIPQLIGWILIYCAKSVLMLYMAGIMMGFSIGFMEAPTLSYVGEISQPHLRAALASFTSICVSIGYVIMYLLGTITTWRMSAAISASVPVITVIAILQVPESPIWLLTKGRKAEAEQSLCWLRGWVSPDLIRNEFLSMIAYVNKSLPSSPKLYSPSKGKVYSEVCGNRSGSSSSEETEIFDKKHWNQIEKLKYVFQPEMLRPLRLVFFFFFFYHCAALSGFRPFMVRIYASLHLPINSHWFTVVAGLLQISGGLCCMSLVHITGKRVISIISITICSTLCMLLGWYTFLHSQSLYSNPWIPLVLFAALFFFLALGINPIPWTLISEVFPTRGRGLGGGISAAGYYSLFFVCTKTFLDLESLIHLHGVFFFYGSLGFVGLVFLYFNLPETEGKKLEDVENSFKSARKTVIA